jgi:predicted DNA-binding protein with PD1-like motif
VNTRISQGVIARLKPGTDIFQGIRDICYKENIHSASIVSMIGSLRKASIVCVTPDQTRNTGARYLEPCSVEGPLELVTVQGLVGRDRKDQEKVLLHLHGTVSTDDMKPVSGHIVDTGDTKVLATVEVTLIIFDQASLLREYDEDTEFELFQVFGSEESRKQ